MAAHEAVNFFTTRNTWAQQGLEGLTFEPSPYPPLPEKDVPKGKEPLCLSPIHEGCSKHPISSTSESQWNVTGREQSLAMLPQRTKNYLSSLNSIDIQLACDYIGKEADDAFYNMQCISMELDEHFEKIFTGNSRKPYASSDGQELNGMTVVDVPQEAGRDTIEVSRGAKGSPKKMLKHEKIVFIDINLFAEAPVSPSLFPVCHSKSRYSLKHMDFLTLQPNTWVANTVVDAYITLFREREELYRQQGIQRWGKFGFMETYFLLLAWAQLNDARKTNTQFDPHNIFPAVGHPLIQCDYIFMPFLCEREQHFVLLFFSKREWSITVVDPKYDDTLELTILEKYKNLIEVAVHVLRVCIWYLILSSKLFGY